MKVFATGCIMSNCAIISFFFIGLFFVFYLAMGASIFSAIESPIEKEEMDLLRQKKAEFLQKNKCITGTFFLESIAITRPVHFWNFEIRLRNAISVISTSRFRVLLSDP